MIAFIIGGFLGGLLVGLLVYHVHHTSVVTDFKQIVAELEARAKKVAGK